MSVADPIAGYIADITYMGAESVPASLREAGELLMASRPLNTSDLENFMRIARAQPDVAVRTEFARGEGGAGALRMLVHLDPVHAPMPEEEFPAERAAAEPEIASATPSKGEPSGATRKRLKLRMVLLVLGVFILGGVSAFLSQGFLAEADLTGVNAAYGDWRLICSPASETASGCVLNQTLADPSTRKPVAQFSVELKNAAPVFAVALPNDVQQQPGVRIVIGKDAPRAYPFTLCNENGCFVSTPLTENLRTALQSADSGRVIFVDLEGNRHGLRFSLRGLKEGMRDFDGEIALRGAWWRRFVTWRMP